MTAASGRIGQIGEFLASRIARKQGETVLDGVKIGTNQGFDLVTIQGKGKDAQLIIREVKAADAVGLDKFRTFNVNASQDNFGRALRKVDDALKNNTSIDATTKAALREQIRNRAFAIEVVGTKGTRYPDDLVKFIQDETGVRNVGFGFTL